MRQLKRDYISTIVSMTDGTGKTGNVDYRDCREPSDSDLVEAANKYGLTNDIKFTITTTVGMKARFVADIINNKLVRKSATSKDVTVLKRVYEEIYLKEKQNLSAYMDVDLTSDECLQAAGVTREEVESRIENKRKGVWKGFSDEFALAMFNYTVTEMALYKTGNGTI